MNLTSSTLFGIFSPTTPSRGSIGGGASGIFESSTPWGTGAETPARDLLVEQPEENDDDDETKGEHTNASAAEIDEVRKASQSLMMLQRQRRRGESFGADGVSGIRLQPAHAGRTKNTSSESAQAAASSAPCRILLFLSLTARAALLFTLGMGYGVLVSRLRSETHVVAFDDLGEPTPSPAETGPASEYVASYDWRYLVSWGLSGIALGTLLPWFDGVWDRSFGRSGSVLAKARTAPETDWALVVRGIGAFAGVAFAMVRSTFLFCSIYFWTLPISFTNTWIAQTTVDVDDAGINDPCSGKSVLVVPLGSVQVGSPAGRCLWLCWLRRADDS